MNPLSDASNRPLVGRSSKRQRLEQLQEPATFEDIVSRAGIRGLTEADTAQLETAEVDDPRQARRQLAADLSTAAACEAFLASLSDALATEALLHKCLLPINVTVQVSYATGDSLVRILLNMPNIQQQLATMLLHKLPEFTQADCDGEGGSNSSSVPSLILGQLRWLEVVVDAVGLTATLLEVLPVCSPAIQQQLIGFLPEVALPQDHEAVVDQLRGLLEQDLSFMAAVLECISNMQLEQELQDHVHSMLLSQLAAVDVEDLPGLVKYLVGSASKANAEQVLTTVRAGFHFVSPSDPRMPVPDHKQKGVMHSSSKSPEVLLVKELVAALQANEAAAAVCLKLETALQTPGSHRCFDLLVLLALHAKGGNSRKAVEACFKRKLLDGHATAAWISKSLQGRKVSFQELWPSLFSLAETWARAKEARLSGAAVQLYVDLFVGVDASLERQQVLQALHGHLGSGVAGEQDVALQALRHLATFQHPLLSQYSSYLANVLDHLEGFTNSQLQQVLSMFAALTAVQPAAVAGTSNAQGAPGGTRLQDELSITIQKALAQNCPGYKRIGVLGTLALLQQKASDYGLLMDAEGAAADAVQQLWVNTADSMFSQCHSQPGALAFMMDQWAEMLEQQGTAPPADQQGEQRQTAAIGRHAVVVQHTTPEPMLEWIHEKVQDLLSTAFLVDYNMQSASEPSEEQQAPELQEAPQPDIQLEDSHLKAQLWFNLDGGFSRFYMNILPVVLSRDPAKRAALAWMPSALRLLAVVLMRKTAGSLREIDALLGCPLAMPESCMFTDGRWDSLPLPSKVGVLTSMLHGICWLREVVAIFAPGAGAMVLAASADTTSQAMVEGVAETQNKVLMRLTQLRMLESLYQHLATSCPAAALHLPDMSCPLLLSVGRGSVGPVTAALKRPPTGQSTKTGKATKPEGPTFNLSEAMARLRCLRLPVVHALDTILPPNMQLASLLPATHIAVDLQAKLKLLVSRARRPAGLIAPAAAAGPAAFPGVPAGSGSALVPGVRSGLPPCIQGLGLQEALEQVVELLPALHSHLALALNVIKTPPEAGREAVMQGLPGAESKAETPLYTIGPMAAAVDALPAAHSLGMACLQIFTLLVGCHKEMPQPLLQQVLNALAGQQQQPAGSEEGLIVAAFKACRKLSCRSSGNSSLQLELAVLSLLQAITVHPVAVASKHYAAMGAKLSSLASTLLQESWQPQDEAEDQTTQVFAWKGQTASVTQLLTVLVSQAKDPSEQVLLLAAAINEVPNKVPMKQQADPYGGYAALCSATMATWYKVVFEQLLSCWDTLVARALALLKAGPAAASKSRADVTQEQTQGSLDWESAEVEELLGKAHRCCLGFASLVQVTKTHPSRTGMQASALKIGGSFVDALLKGMPFWRALYGSGQEQQFKALIKEVQKGTKQLQTICNEGKARSAGALLAKAPAAKKSLETFVFAMKAFLYEQGQQDLFYLGQLKHRDLEGNCVGSQLCESQDEEDENDEADDDDEIPEDSAKHDERDNASAQ